MDQKCFILILVLLLPVAIFCQDLTPIPGDLTPIPGDLTPIPGDLTPIPGDLTPLPDEGDLTPGPAAATPLPGEPTSIPERSATGEEEPSPLPDQPVPSGEEPPPLPEEEKEWETLFDFKIGDTEVDFYLTGSWTFTVFAATGMLITPDGGVQWIDSFPSFPDGFYFQQIPDITLAVWILEKFFLEVTYQGEEKDNLFLAGYEGNEDELIRHIYIGNSNINLSPSPYLSIPEAGNSSIGAQALLHTSTSEHELLLRYDYNTAGKKIFKGKNEVEETRFSPEEYIRGYYFKLPDNGIENVEVYLQDPLGLIKDQAGRHYKRGDATDIVLDAQTGTLLLKEECPGRILIYYTKDGIPVGNPANGTGALVGEDSDNAIAVDNPAIDFSFGLIEHLGQDMTANDISLNNGRLCLLLYEPGIFSSFEIESTYEVVNGFPADQWMVETSLVQKGTYTQFLPENPVLFKADTNNNRLIVTADENLRTNFRNLYPFIDTSPGIYGPESSGSHFSEKYEILLELLFPVSYYYLDTDVIPGSIRVLRNGIEENRFTVNYDTGIINFQITILPTDRLEVYYNQKSSNFDNGDIVFGWKNKININDTTFFELSTGLTWNAIPGTYTEEAYSKTGSIIGLCSFQTSTDNFKFSLSGATSFTNPDTTGIFRLLGMEESGLDIALSEETAWPCSLPKNHGLTTFPALERGQLIYKNYRDYGIMNSSTLKPLTWDIPDDQIFEYKTGSKSGPYLVSGSSTSDGEGSSLVMDFIIPDNKSWTGIQIPLIREYRPIDLSYLTALSFSYKVLDLNGTIDVHIQIGDITEDIDGDGILDEELSTSSTGFLFHDTSNNAVLKIGGGPQGLGNNRKDSEDTNNNRFLDPEVTDRVISILPPALNGMSGDTQWQQLNIFLTDSEKQSLKRSQYIRIIVSTEEIGEVRGKFLLDRLFFSGEIHWQKEWLGSSTLATENLEVREISENFAVNKPSTYLEQAYPETKTVFHPKGENQKVLEIRWENVEVGEGWELYYANMNQTGNIIYENLTFYIRSPVNPVGSEKITFSLIDYRDKGIRCTIPAQYIPEWKKMTINTKTKKVSLGSREIQAELEIDSDYMSFSGFSLELMNEDDGVSESSGILYIDEIHLTSPQLEIGAAVSLETTATIPGDMVTIKDISILSDLYFHEKASFVSRGFSPLYGETAPSNMTQSLSELSFGLFFTTVAMDLTILGDDDDFTTTGGHSISLPKDSTRIKFEDSYKMLPGEGGNNFFRSDSFTLNNKNNVALLTLLTSAYTLESLLVQNWNITAYYPYKDLLSFSSTTTYVVSSDSYTNNDEWYLPAWIYGFQYIAPVQNSLLNERAGKLSTDIELMTKPVGTGLTGNIAVGSNNIEENRRNYSSSTDLEVSLPVTVIPTKTLTLVITPAYKKAFTIQNPFMLPGDFIIDIEQWARDLEDHTYILQLPFVELYSKKAEEEFTAITQARATQSATYAPEFSIALNKNSPGSHITDLFIPSSSEFSMMKHFVKNYDLYDFFNTYTVSAGFKAINLFGKFGAYSLCDLYTIDEFVYNYSLTLISRPEETGYESDLTHFMSFADNKQNKFLIENHFILKEDDFFSLTDFGSFSFIWNILPKLHPPLPFIPKEVVGKSYYTNEESISYSISNYEDPQILNHMNILLGHSTSLQFPPHGYIKAGLILGFDLESIEQDFSGYEALRIAIQAGIEAHIQW
ncbi:MAG: hypothetical protein JXJ04_17880 [Spirochaetales bacterium]|nr:hypothetical protein [Spirochaetales bacterium]